MSAYGGMSSSNSKNQSMSSSKFSQDVWAGQAPYLQGMYGDMKKVAMDTLNMMNPYMQQASQNAINTVNQAKPAWQQQMKGGAYEGFDPNMLYSSLASSLGQPTNTQQINNMIMGGAGNNYADAMKASYIQDANRAQQNMLNNLDARTAAMGGAGSSRTQIAKGIGMEDINRNLQQNMAKVGYETFDKDLDRKLAIAQQADQAQLSRQGMLGDILAGKQSAMKGGLDATGMLAGAGASAIEPFMARMSVMQPYAQALGSPTVLNRGNSLANALGRSNSFGFETGGGVSHICTALYDLGYLTDDEYITEALYGTAIAKHDVALYNGYSAWARPFAKWLLHNPRPIGVPVANLIATYLVKPWIRYTRGKSGKPATVLFDSCVTICRAIGEQHAKQIA